MAGVSKAVSNDVFIQAQNALKELGKAGEISRKLQAIIAAKNVGVSLAAQVFCTSRPSLMAWINNFSHDAAQGLKIKPGRGRKPFVDAEIREKLRQFMQKNPNTTMEGVKKYIKEKHSISISVSSANRLMKQLHLSYITPRPKHYKAVASDQEAFKKKLREKVKNSPQKRVFFFDESRFGTHSKLGHGWFPTGKRTQVHVKLGFANFYLYSAIEPRTGENFTLEIPNVNEICMNVFLEEFAKTYPNEEVILVMDGAGWHKSKGLQLTDNIEIVLLPPYSPELNPVERFWQSLKQNTIRNKVYATLDALKQAVAKYLNSMEITAIQSLCTADYL